ncbi:hypothetical protein D3C78_1802570 [compost metagenome]
MALVVGKAVEAEFEFDRQRLVGHLKRQLEWLQVRHAASASVDNQVIPLHVFNRAEH